MAINPVDPVGLTVPPPQEPPPVPESEGVENTPPPENVPLPPDQGANVDELA